MVDYTKLESKFKRHLLQISQLPLAAEAIIHPIASEAPVALNYVPHFHLLPIEACRYLIVDKAWRIQPIKVQTFITVFAPPRKQEDGITI